VAQEFYRGIRARRRMFGEAPVQAFVRLIGRNRRRYGGYLVHLGVLVYFVAFAGSIFKVTKEVTLVPGEKVELRSPFGHTYSFTFLGISQYQALNRQVSSASLEIRRDGATRGVLTSEKRQHVNSFGEPTFQPSTEVGIHSGLREDLYVVYAGSIGGTERSNFAITINPLVWWVWAGGVILVIGGLTTMWPGGRASVPVVAPSSAQAGFEARLVGTEA
jgi:cytochrome c-type biogenesis protein CcmF